MIELGKFQRLEVKRITKIGVYLNVAKASTNDDVLLPNNQVPNGIELYDEVEVFVYRDSEDRIIATMKTPKLILGEIAVLKVIEATKFGAFLDWGLEKDLFLPFKEQLGFVSKGDSCLVCLYLDKSQRLCATMKIYNLLSCESPFNERDWVRGTICNVNPVIGAFVAVENRYQGLIPANELYDQYSEGDRVQLRIKRILPDGKLELSPRREAYHEIESDSQKIMACLKSNEGYLNLNDKSSPEEIKAKLNVSKNAFKRAVGRLLKEGAIEFTQTGIKLTWN